MRTLFQYVDYSYSTPEGITAKWERIHISKISELVYSRTAFNVFTSIQMFKGDIHQDEELQWVPLFFDLDSQDLEIALLDARALVNYFSQMDLGQEHIRVYFSGSKGFHIVLTPELFGIKPHHELTYIIKNACTYVAQQLKLQSFDTRVYSIRRLWRLPESVHQKTKLFCTEITHGELSKDITALKEIARGVTLTSGKTQARDPIWDDSIYHNIDPNQICCNWFLPFVHDYETQRELQNLRPKNPIKPHPGEDPVCITDLLGNSIRKEGTRNQAEMALMSYYKDTGVDETTANTSVIEWAKAIPKGLTSKTDRRALEADVKGVGKTVFDGEHGDKYHFACHFIRALGAGTDKPIACAFERCKFVNQEDQEPEQTIKLKLPEATRAVYIGKKIQADVMIAGKDDAPYGVPSHINIKCKPDMQRENSVCLNCAIAVFGGLFEFKFSAKDQSILHLLDTNDVNQKTFIKKKCGIPDRCNRHRMDIKEFVNVTEVLLIPRIDFRPDTMTEEEPYVIRKGFFVGHDIEPNKEYQLSAYTYPSPRDQHLVHVIDEARPLTDDIVQFAPTQEILESLKIFQIILPNGKRKNTKA